MIIKKFPEDFVVDEMPAFSLKDSGDYAVYKLTKNNYNTEDAIMLIADRFHIPRNNIKYAGTKDKNAITTQYISIHKDKGRLSIEMDRISLEFIGFADEPLSLGSLKGNNFKVTARDITEEEYSSFNKSTANIKGNFLVPNYFDEQRFSENNLDIGLAILKKDYKKAATLIVSSGKSYEQAVKMHLEANTNDYVGAIKKVPKKILQMYVHSFQSYMFNEALAGLLRENAKEKNIVCHEVSYSLSQFIFYDDPADYRTVDLRELDMYGFGSASTDRYTQMMLDKYSLSSRDFIVRAIPDLSVDGTRRDVFSNVENFSYEIDNVLNEEGILKKIVLDFSLGKGSYATIVVKALF